MSEVRISYCDQVRDRIGTEADSVPLTNAVPLDDLLARLQSISTRHRAVFAEPGRLRFAINEEIALLSAKVKPGDTLLIFLPLTGG